MNVSVTISEIQNQWTRNHRVASLLDHAPHLVSVEAKRDPDAVERFVAGVRNATACWTRPPRARVLDRGRAILKPGIAPKPFVPIRYDPGDSAVPARNPRRANAKELRRAYDRARVELKTLELEARPKSDRKPDLHAIEQVHLRRKRRADGVGYIDDDGVGHP